jgi:GAF domain-containing protein
MDSISQNRLAALAAYEVMDSPPEESFDEITRLTSFICGTPIALISLLDTRRQWFKSMVGLTDREMPIEQAFCAHTIRQHGLMMVPDATLDERFAAYPNVLGDPRIRFYAGAPLVTPEGVPVGSLCAIDRVPRDLDSDRQEALRDLASQVVRCLEARKTVKALQVALAEKQRAQNKVALLQDLLPMCAWCRKVRDDEHFWHRVEDYLSKQAEVKITHGVCPDCYERLRAEIEGDAVKS